MRNFGWLVMVGVIWSFPSYAFCSKPDAPSCATDFGRFDDSSDFDSCKSEVDSYRSEVEEFLSCQKRENDDVISDYNDAVRSFNDRARGG